MGKKSANQMQDLEQVNEGFDAPELTTEQKEEAAAMQAEREEAEKEAERIEQAEREQKAALKIQEAKEALNVDDGFENVDTGNFSFEDLAVGSVFYGSYIEEWTSEDDGGTDKVTGLLFINREGQRKVLPKWYQIYNFFVNRDSKTPIDWNKKALFRITVVSCEEAKKGKVYNVDIAVKYLS